MNYYDKIIEEATTMVWKLDAMQASTMTLGGRMNSRAARRTSLLISG